MRTAAIFAASRLQISWISGDDRNIQNAPAAASRMSAPAQQASRIDRRESRRCLPSLTGSDDADVRINMDSTLRLPSWRHGRIPHRVEALPVLLRSALFPALRPRTARGLASAAMPASARNAAL